MPSSILFVYSKNGMTSRAAWTMKAEPMTFTPMVVCQSAAFEFKLSDPKYATLHR